MAFANTHHAASDLRHYIIQPFAAFGALIIRLAKASPHAAAVDRLNALSDEDLAAMNTTRQAEVERIFHIYMNA